MALSVVENSKVFTSNFLVNWLLLRSIVAVRFMEFLECAITRSADFDAANNKVATVAVATTMSANTFLSIFFTIGCRLKILTNCQIIYSNRLNVKGGLPHSGANLIPRRC